MNISSLKTDYLNLYSGSCFGKNSERAYAVQKKCTFCEGTNHYAEKCFKRIRNEKEKSRAVDVSDNIRTEHRPRKCFRFRSEDHMIAKFPKPPKILKNGEGKYVLLKKLIVHTTTAKTTVTKIHMHL